MKTILFMAALLISMPGHAAKAHCPVPGKQPENILFRSPDEVRTFNHIQNEGYALGGFPSNMREARLGAQAVAAWSVRLEGYIKNYGSVTCSGDLYQYNPQEIDTFDNAIFIQDITTGQIGWTDATEFLKDVQPTPD